MIEYNISYDEWVKGTLEHKTQVFSSEKEITELFLYLPPKIVYDTVVITPILASIQPLERVDD